MVRVYGSTKRAVKITIFGEIAKRFNHFIIHRLQGLKFKVQSLKLFESSTLDFKH